MGKRKVIPKGGMDQFPAKGLTPEEALVSKHLEEQVRKVLQTLTPLEQKILRMRFGIGEETSDFPATREVIRRIEANAMHKLWHSSRAKLPK